VVPELSVFTLTYRHHTFGNNAKKYRPLKIIFYLKERYLILFFERLIAAVDDPFGTLYHICAVPRIRTFLHANQFLMTVVPSCALDAAANGLAPIGTI